MSEALLFYDSLPYRDITKNEVCCSIHTNDTATETECTTAKKQQLI